MEVPLLHRRPALAAGLWVALATGCTSAPPEAFPVGSPAPAHLSFATGYKALGSDWSGADDHWMIGLLDGDLRPPGWPVWIASQFLFSYASDAPDSAPGFADFSETYELSLGLRRYGSWGRIEPWIGAGATWFGAAVSEGESGWGYGYDVLDDDYAWGWYADAGLQVPLNPTFTLGFALRWSDSGSAELFGEEFELGGLSALFLIGARF